MSILLIDDELFNYELLKALLGNKYQLNYADSAEQGLAMSMTSLPDVILLDICMPGLDGYDTCRLLKNAPETQHIPVILLTGLDNDEDQKEGFAAGCDAYITKPIEVTELIKKIKQLSETKI